MDPENLHKDSPENLPEDSPKELPDKNKSKLRKLLNAISKLSKSTFSALKSGLDSVKGWARKLSGPKNSLSKWLDAKNDKLRRIKRELVIWVLSVAVISLVAAITNYIMKQQQVAGQRIWQLERQLEDTIDEKTLLESKLAQMPGLRDRLTNLFEEKQLRAAIKEKRAIENKLKDTVTRLEKTVGQLEEMGRLEENLANNVEEITRLRENLSQLEQQRESVESLARLANSWPEPEAEMQETKATIEMKRLVEKKLKDTAGQLEKTAQQLKGVGRLKEQFANNLEEITRLKKDLAEQLESQRSINELLGWQKTEVQGPETNKAQRLPPALDEEKPKLTPIAVATELQPGFFKKSILAIVFGIALGGVTGLCFFGARGQWLRKLFKKRLPEEKLHKFEYLEDISFTLLGGLLLKGFVKMGYKVTSSSGITSGRLTCVLEKENEKALFRYIICKEDDFGRGHVEDFANSMEAEKVDKGYLVTTGAVAGPVLTLAKEKSIELAGKEILVELIPSCLLQKGLMKKLSDTKVELIKQAQIAKHEMAKKEALSEKLKESENMITKLNDEKTALGEEFKTKEEEHNNLLKKHEYIREELRKQNEEISSLDSERNRLHEEIRQKHEKAIYLTDDLEEKLAKKEQELSEKEEALKKLSDQGKLKEAVSGELEELKTNNRILQQSLAEKERLIDSFNKLQKDLETELSAKTELITEIEHQLSLAEQEAQKEDVTAITELKEQLVKEKKEALKEVSERIGALTDELKAKDELISKLREENLQLLEKKDASTKRAVTKLQNEVSSYLAEMENMLFPSLDLSSLADRGVLMKLEPEGPVVMLKNIAADGVSFESQRKLDIPSSCNITMIFFGSSNPLTARAGLVWQKKVPGSSMYNIRFRFLSLKPGQSRRINEYINKIRKALNKVKK